MAVKHGFVLLALAGAVGCSAAYPSDGSSAQVVPHGTARTQSTPIAPTRALRAMSVCGAFGRFELEMMRLTPKAQVALVPYAQAVQGAALHHLKSISHAEFNAVGNFVAWVGGSRFSYYGNVTSKPYVRMQHYCP